MVSSDREKLADREYVVFKKIEQFKIDGFAFDLFPII